MDTEIWLRWWTEANDRPGDVNDGMYYGIYAMLLMLVVVFVGLDCWFMFVKIIPKSAKKLHWTLLNTTLQYVLPHHKVPTVTEFNQRSDDLFCRHKYWRPHQQVKRLKHYLTRDQPNALADSARTCRL